MHTEMSMDLKQQSKAKRAHRLRAPKCSALRQQRMPAFVAEVERAQSEMST